MLEGYSLTPLKNAIKNGLSPVNADADGDDQIDHNDSRT